MQGSGCRVQGAWFRVQGSGLLEVGVAGLGLDVRLGY